MKGSTVINCIASHILFVVEVYDCQRSPNNLSNMYYQRLRSWMDTVESGSVDQDLRQLSELDLSSRDPINGFNLDDADASI